MTTPTPSVAPAEHDLRVTVLIPVFNEERTLERRLAAVEARAEIVSEIVIVDDASADATASILANRPFAIPTTVVRHERNRGKGAAIRTGLAHATGMRC